MENQQQDTVIITVPFIHATPNSEYIGHEMYQLLMELALRDIFNYGSYQPAILAGAIEAVMNEIESSLAAHRCYAYNYDEVYGELMRFLETTLMSFDNSVSLNSLTTLYGTGTIVDVLKSMNMTSIILVVNNPIKTTYQPQ